MSVNGIKRIGIRDMIAAVLYCISPFIFFAQKLVSAARVDQAIVGENKPIICAVIELAVYREVLGTEIIVLVIIVENIEQGMVAKVSAVKAGFFICFKIVSAFKALFVPVTLEQHIAVAVKKCDRFLLCRKIRVAVNIIVRQKIESFIKQLGAVKLADLAIG